mgnify:CR=1 FL=1
MKLPSGRMCAVATNANGEFIITVYPTTSLAETVKILQEWVSVNPNHALTPVLIVGLEGMKGGRNRDH